MIKHLSHSAKSMEVFLLYEPNIKCPLLTILKGSLGMYYSQLTLVSLKFVCIFFSSQVRKKLGVHITVEKGRQNCLSETAEELVQRWSFFTMIMLTKMRMEGKGRKEYRGKKPNQNKNQTTMARQLDTNQHKKLE